MTTTTYKPESALTTLKWTAEGQVGTLAYQTKLDAKNETYLDMKINIEGDKSYFKAGEEFRVVLEWIKGADNNLVFTRDYVHALYVPIEDDGSMNFKRASGMQKEPKGWGKAAFPEYNYKYFASYP